MIGTLWKIVRFGIAGAIGMVIDFGTTWVCRKKLKWNKYLANTTGFTLAAINNYIINRFWTFASSNPNWQAEFSKFLLFSLAGLALNNLLVFLLHGRLKMNFYVSKLIATICVFAWNFSTNYFFNFK